MADIITTLHPEGAPEDDLYPNIKKENLPASLQKVSDFASAEYEKTLNLLDSQFESGLYDYNTGIKNSSNTYLRNVSPTRIEPNTTYTFSFSYNTTKEISLYYVCFYSIDGTFISSRLFDATSYGAPRTFTAPNNAHFVSVNFRAIVQLTTSDVYDVMLNIDDTPLPFVRYYGKIAHLVDVEGVLLWLNGNPNSALAPVTLNFDSSRYKYLIVEMKPLINVTYSRQYLKCRNMTGYVYLSESSEGTDYDRELYINSGTGIEIRGGYIDATPSNDACIVTAIYGVE